jgi:hypothetical protein
MVLRVLKCMFVCLGDDVSFDGSGDSLRAAGEQCIPVRRRQQETSFAGATDLMANLGAIDFLLAGLTGVRRVGRASLADGFHRLRVDSGYGSDVR